MAKSEIICPSCGMANPGDVCSDCVKFAVGNVLRNRDKGTLFEVTRIWASTNPLEYEIGGYVLDTKGVRCYGVVAIANDKRDTWELIDKYTLPHFSRKRESRKRINFCKGVVLPDDCEGGLIRILDELRELCKDNPNPWSKDIALDLLAKYGSISQ